MDLMSYGSVFKYESNNTKSVWYHLQILRLSVRKKLTSSNLGLR